MLLDLPVGDDSATSRTRLAPPTVKSGIIRGSVAHSLATPSVSSPRGHRSAAHDSGEMANRLTEAFTKAVQQAIATAHAAGLAVSGSENGIAVELLPDGTKRPIDESCEWSPTAWRDS